GRNLLQGGGAVHLVPEEALLLGEQKEPIRRLVLQDEARRQGQPRAELRDLVRALVDPARPRVEIADDTRDLTELEVALVVAPDEQLELRGRRPLHHRASTSRPVASRPQRVPSATCLGERRTRSIRALPIP